MRAIGHLGPPSKSAELAITHKVSLHTWQINQLNGEAIITEMQLPRLISGLIPLEYHRHLHILI